MNFETCYNRSDAILMEGAVAERIKHEFNIKLDEKTALAGLIYTEKGRSALTAIYTEYLHIAEKYQLPFIVTTPTRRANYIRVKEAGYDEKIIYENAVFLRNLQKNAGTTMFTGGLMGCKGDAYTASEVLSAEEAYDFHRWQADLLRDAGVDFLYAGIMPALPEAEGMAEAMAHTGLPYIISFMIRKDGKLLDGTTISDAIQKIDALPERKPVCYMSNCIHPVILEQALAHPFNCTRFVKERFHGIQANTAALSPEELNNSAELITSDGAALADEIMNLRKFADIKIFGGCCGTDATHMEEIAKRISAC
ncbi:MAG: homocysteine S-methyltransferase family protein [Treponema sp.]|nr:homocysteine S-methyltransferase family protein [Treponema sp.]